MVSNAIAGYVNVEPMSKTIDTKVKDISSSTPIMPVITWGGDIATVFTNGSALTTQRGSIFTEEGVSLTLVNQNSFDEQVQKYLAGEQVYLRGTLDMILTAIEKLSADPRTVPVVIYQETWSTGGDVLVVRQEINRPEDLRGKTIVLQAHGPHVAYLFQVLRDSGLSVNDVKIRWVKDIVGLEGDTPGAMMKQDSSVDAVFVISPDAFTMTSGGKIGDGSEGSIKGAKFLLSTKTADKVIADIVAVRQDYFNANKDKVQKVVHGLMRGNEQLTDLVANKSTKKEDYKKIISASAEFLLGSKNATADAEGLYADCTFVGFAGNVQFFVDKEYPRNLEKMSKQIQSSLIDLKLLSKEFPVISANWNYEQLKNGLQNTQNVIIPKFDSAKVAAYATKNADSNSGDLFSLTVNFEANQSTFTPDLYATDFDRIIELSATYGGAIMSVVGYTDTEKYNQLRKTNADNATILTKAQQAGKNLSFQRALGFINAIVTYAESKGILLDRSQFTPVGMGYNKAKYADPKTEEEKRANRRVEFKLINFLAE